METHFPPEFFAAPPAHELAVVDLERAVDCVASHSQRLGPSDVEDLRRCANRLLTVIADAVERRAA